MDKRVMDNSIVVSEHRKIFGHFCSDNNYTLSEFIQPCFVLNFLRIVRLV